MYENINANQMLNKVVLFTAELYLSESIKDGLTNDNFHIGIVNGVRSFMNLRKFSFEESELLKSIGEEEYMLKIKKVEISFVVYALELLKLWVEEMPRNERKTIHLGVSNKKLRMGSAAFAIEMIKLKNRDKIIYDEKKEIIMNSKVTAKKFYHYMEQRISEEIKNAKAGKVKRVEGFNAMR